MGSPLAAFFFLVFIGVTVTITVIVTARKNQRDERRTALILETEQGKALDVRKVLDAVTEKTIPLEAPLAELRRRAEQGVRVVLNEPLRKPARTATAAHTVAPPPEATPGQPVSPTPDAPTPPPKPRKEVVRGEDVPEGEPTREELDARHRGETREPAPKPAPTATAAPADRAAPPPRPVAPPESARGTPRIRQLADDLLTDTDAVEANVQAARELADLVRREELEIQREIRVQIVAKRTEVLRARLSTAEEIFVATEQALARAVKAADTIDSLREEHEREEADRKRNEEEARRQREYTALVERELAAVNREELDTNVLISRHLYEQALEKAEAKTSAFASKEGATRHAIVVDQCRELVKLKTFLGTALKNYPMRWGWKQEAPSRDIIGADRDLLHLTEKQVKWEDVTSAQAAMIVNHFLGSPKTSATLQVDYAVPLALFFAKAGNAEQARYFINRAVGLDPTLQARADRLVPME